MVCGSSWNVRGMSDEPSGTRLRRTVRLDEGGFNALCRIADAYWDGKRHSAADAALVDALCPPTPIPTATSEAFANQVLAPFIETCAQRLNQNKRFHYGADVVRALQEGAAPLSRPLSFVPEPVPMAPWALTVPLELSGQLPESGLRAFIDGALQQKAAWLGLSGPATTLPLPTQLPHIETIIRSRHMDEALVAILAGLPWVPAGNERVPAAMRWLRSTLALRG